MSRIFISLLLCTAFIIAQDSTDTGADERQVLIPNVAADSLLSSFIMTDQDTSQMKLTDRAKIILSEGKEFIIENKKELGIYAGFGVLIYIISEIVGEEQKPNPEIGNPPDWPQ
ncbi:hypothetical protein KJ762_08220 [bacterium]|nr:hypothetical protein [bacterium]MBU1063468.1 hypothetical protein [bacterium]MBU1634478.1 hypothetical protein [bacterium]MBU1874644.1 hypothetical protein [bacterium]